MCSARSCAPAWCPVCSNRLWLNGQCRLASLLRAGLLPGGRRQGRGAAGAGGGRRAGRGRLLARVHRDRCAQYTALAQARLPGRRTRGARSPSAPRSRPPLAATHICGRPLAFVLADAERVRRVARDGLLAEHVLRALHDGRLAHALQRVLPPRRLLCAPRRRPFRQVKMLGIIWFSTFHGDQRQENEAAAFGECERAPGYVRRGERRPGARGGRGAGAAGTAARQAGLG